MNLPDFSSGTPLAIALDLDQTTLNSSSRLDDRTRRALHAVHEIGLPMIIATSRPERVMPVLVGDDISNITSLVQMNGTVATGRAGLQGTVTCPMDLVDAQKCWDLTNQLVPAARMTMEIDGFQFAVNHEDDINELWAYAGATPNMVVPVDQAIRLGPTKVSVNGENGNLEQLASTLVNQLSEQTQIFSAVHEQFLNVVSRQATKSSAVATLLESANISLDAVLAFGDDHVDADLIRDSGWSVAVENAIPEIKSMAKFETASNDEFGVAIVLENLVFALK